MLIDTLLLAVQAARNASNKNHKEIYYQERDERNKSVTLLAEGLHKGFIDTISTIRAIIDDARLTPEQKVGAIDLTLKPEETEKINFEQSITEFKKNITNTQQGQSYYDLLEDNSLKLQNRVADIMRHTIFEDSCGKPLLLEAILHYQRKSGTIDKGAPTAFMTTDQRAALLGKDGKFRVSLYKILLYIAVADAIKSGVLNVVHSSKYRPLDDYLITKHDWNAHRTDYLCKAQLEQYTDCKTVLALLKKELAVSYKETNDDFIAGNNKFLTFKSDGSFHVSTPKLEEAEGMCPLGSIFPVRKYIPLQEVLSTVDEATGFLKEFEHWQVSHHPKKPEKRIFYAGIMAYGCDIGHRKLAQISKQINENELDNTLNWYFSLSNVQGANDRVVQFMDQMDLPNIYRQKAGVLHTSNDGQKCSVAVDSLNSNYSFKYLGKDKGGSVLTFIDSRQMMWHSTVISSAEREAAYVIDGLMHNDVIKSDIHSTDTHGYSEVVFAVTYLLGFTFAPRIKGLGHQQLCGFANNKKALSQQTTEFKPDKYVNEVLLESQSDEILRFVATIKLKITTASQLFKRLNSYSKQHPLYMALREFGRIHKTLFILKYVFDPEFRQAIEKQLNKVEGSNKLSRAISLGNEFLQGDKEDQEIAEGCRRLIKNALICWNYLFLDLKVNGEEDEVQKQTLIESASNDSIMRWSHFNLNGEFDFSDEKMKDSIGFEFPQKPPPKAA